MTFVVGENCIKCKYTDCVEVCPVDCFYEGPNFLVIHPDECIDCALCEPECPVQAIFSEDELPEDQHHFLDLNAELADLWPNITQSKEPPEDAAEWDGGATAFSAAIAAEVLIDLVNSFHLFNLIYLCIAGRYDVGVRSNKEFKNESDQYRNR